MKKITLSEAQKSVLMNGLAEIHDEDGRFDINIEIDEEITINAKGWLELDGYREDDYYNGTGAWVETGRAANIDLTAYENGEPVELDKEIEKEAHKYLNAA